MKNHNLIREKARDIIGQPKPTSVRQRRKGGQARNAVDGASGHYVKMSDYTDRPLPGAPRLSQVRSVKSALPNVQPHHWHAIDEGVVYSNEVRSHCVYLETTQGPEAVKAYLNNLRNPKQGDEPSMSSAYLAEQLTRNEKPTGSIETVLREALEKHRHFHNEAQRCQMEADRWKSIADNLEATLKLVNAPAATLKPDMGVNGKVARKFNSNPKPRGFWEERLKSFFAQNGNQPIVKTDFFKPFTQFCKTDVSQVYAAIAHLRNKGIIEEIANGLDTKIVLAKESKAIAA